MRHALRCDLAGALIVILTVLFLASPVAATEAPDAPDETESTEATDEELANEEQLREGSAVYTQICASCHQAGGIGLEGQFPPLINNENLDDPAYIEDVITNGRSGELTVAGVVYDGVMPSFSTLSEDDTDAVVAFIENDFVAPAVEAAPQLGPVAGTELPALTNMTYALTVFISLGLVALVLGPRVISEESRLNFPWFDAWLRTGVIVASIILLTVVIPDWAIKTETVGSLSRFAQDLIGVSLWAAGMAAVLWGLWYAHGRSRI